uniref:RING-type E3 ubiquitin transferase n=1 Tax=Ciona intestinalis TaxID=7719 RepID=Q1RPZ8_CIOIN|nr:zinc finger protein [Ciona intestinalis]BAE93287.1 zinc finger protein [Ciona intestinalis]|eukprot:NP_001071903.1 zinc finger protein [Ciona intestinalis]
MTMSTSSSNLLELMPRKRQRSTDNWATSVLECGVCGEQFSLSGEKVPRLLLCGHSFCHDCLTRLPVQAHTLVCPMDRQITDVGSGGVWGLKKNFALIELMEKLQLGGTRINLSKSDTPSNSKVESRDNEDKKIVCCDEDEKHAATLYCLVCCTNLCNACSTSTHSTKTLSKHRRISLEDKPQQPAMCPLHQTHALEFACLEEGCQYSPAMCYLCKEHGKHKGHQHNLIEVVARSARSTAAEASERASAFLAQVVEHIMRSQAALDRIEGGTRLSTSQSGVVERQQYSGSAESARTCVRDYFCRLRESLASQEEVAISTLDTHVRNRITALRRLHDDATALRSQISTALSHCNNVSHQDDCSILASRSEVDALDHMLDQQQRQFTEQTVAASETLDPSIPVTFTKDNRIHIGRKLEIRIVTLGLDGAGKTTLLFKLKQDEFMQPIPTIGFNVETVDYRNLRFTVWDVGGKHKLRPLWKHYYLNTQAVLFVVDSCDTQRFEEAHTELAKLMSEKDLREAALLVLANKQDLPGAASCDEVAARLNLHKLCCGRSWRAIPCDASSGAGLEEGLLWLSRQLVAAGVLEVA